MSTRKVMDLLATWCITLGSARVVGVSESGCHQFSTRVRSPKAGRVSDSCAGGAGPQWHGMEDEPTWGHSNSHWPDCQQTGHALTGSPTKEQIKIEEETVSAFPWGSCEDGGMEES